MSLKVDYFELFDLPRQYAADTRYIKTRYRELQRKAHPDKFAGASQQDQLLSVQYAAAINDAYDVLMSPLKRAIYLLNLKGVEINNDQSGSMDPAFLMEQMELRESLDDVRHASDAEAALEGLSQRIEDDLDELQQAFAEEIEQADDPAYAAAVDTVKKMQFLVKLQDEVALLERELLDT